VHPLAARQGRRPSRSNQAAVPVRDRQAATGGRSRHPRPRTKMKLLHEQALRPERRGHHDRHRPRWRPSCPCSRLPRPKAQHLKVRQKALGEPTSSNGVAENAVGRGTARPVGGTERATVQLTAKSRCRARSHSTSDTVTKRPKTRVPPRRECGAAATVNEQ